MHSIQTDNQLVINAINAFNDNYIWCIHSKTSQQVGLVDPGDANVCIHYLEENNLQLSSIYITHRHPDHVGGVEKLVAYCHEKSWPITVYGPTKEAQEYSMIQVSNDTLIEDKALNLQCRVIDVPGHTLGHIAFLIEDNLFCGDTLFSAGCGRIFDGTAEDLFNSLNTLAALPEKTRVYCAHEYTMANLAFALTVDPTNEELINYYNSISKLRENGQRSIPTSICTEKKINPFLRCYDSNIKESVDVYSTVTPSSDVETFIALRQWKNDF